MPLQSGAGLCCCRLCGFKHSWRQWNQAPSLWNINQPAAPDPLTALAVSLVPISCFSHGQDVSFLLNRQCCTPTLTFKQPKFRASTRTVLMATRPHHLVVCQETHLCDSGRHDLPPRSVTMQRRLLGHQILKS